MLRVAMLCAMTAVTATAVTTALTAERREPRPAEKRTPADDPVFQQEAGTWTTIYKVWPDGFGGTPTAYPGVEKNTLSADRMLLSRSYESKGLFDHLVKSDSGKDFKEDAFKWGTGHGGTLRYDQKTGKYVREWPAASVTKRLGWMEGKYDAKEKTLIMKYVNPYKTSVDNSRINHKTTYVDAGTKKTVVTIEVPENRGTPLPTSFIMFEIIAKKSSN